MKAKTYNKTASLYADKLRSKGYSVRFNWIDDTHYEDVTVRGRVFRGYGREFSTPKQAYDYIFK